jgi:acetylornithine deacetylase/succinyl-diaminopimelate desuccinylase-like protein
MTELTERLLDLACAIQQIPAPTFHEQARAAFVRDQFLALDLREVEVDDLGNVYGKRPGGSARPVLITAHTDTVFPLDMPLTLSRTPERITGPGIGDNALGVAGLCALAQAVNGESLPGDLCLAANVGEEGLGDLRGMRRVIERWGQQVGAIIVLEGMALGYIQCGGIGVRRYRLSARAEGGHSWLHFGRPSAIHALVRLGAHITDLVVPRTPKTTFNIGVIGGGTSINTIAREASLELDLRSEDPATLSALAARVEELAASFNSAGAQIEARLIGRRPSGVIARDHPLIQLAVRAAREADLPHTFENGSTDANLPLSLGLPCVSVGLAYGGNAHRPDEYIETRDLDKGWQAFVQTVRGAFAL